MNDLRFLVTDLIGRPGERRTASGTIDLDLQVGESEVRGPAHVDVTMDGIDDGVIARFEASFTATLACTRCLTEWEQPMTASGVQIFEGEPDEDGYALGADDTVDLSGPVRDEVALAVPVRPLCRADCAGLCPTCGTDLNRDPCGGHDEPSSSPFDALKGLFEDNDLEGPDSPQEDASDS